MSPEGYALELRGIGKRFGSALALDNASLAVRAGTLHMLLGENGAGKTSLLNVAVGNVAPDAGTIALRGRPVQWRSRAEALTAGLSAVYQHFSLVPAMTVAENVALAARSLGSAYSARDAAASVERIADAAGLSGVDPAAIVGDLPVAAQQRVEIIKAIAHDSPVLLLDEPTAVLSPSEAEDLFAWLRSFVSGGRTAIVITHRIREALRHADAVTVLRGGRTTLQASMPDTDERAVLSAILGESADSFISTAARRTAPATSPAGTPRLTMVNAGVVASTGVVRLAPTSLTVRAGEIVGVAGVDGAGQREFLRLLAGRIAPSTGSVECPSRIGFVPEDRLRDAIVAGFSLVENFALHDAGSRVGVIPWGTFGADTHRAMRAFDVRAENETAVAGNLSGGNQQKFVLARELADAPEALVAENPTRGLDVRASREILERLRAARDAGTAVVVYSSDVDELLAIADRVLVCYAGVVREADLDADRIGRAMVGAT